MCQDLGARGLIKVNGSFTVEISSAWKQKRDEFSLAMLGKFLPGRVIFNLKHGFSMTRVLKSSLDGFLEFLQEK